MAAAEKTLESLANRMLDLENEIAKSVSAEDTYAFIASKKNANTKKKTESDINRFKAWLSHEDETADFEQLPPKELDMNIARYFMSVKHNKTKKELEPGTLKGMQGSIKRYLNDKNYPHDIMTDKLFRHSRELLKAKAVDLKEKGLGNRAKRADPFTRYEIEILYDKQLLGSGSPQALVNTIWLNNTMHFGLRGRQEHISMLWGDLELGQTADGTRYVSYTERATKTRKGINTDPRMFKPKIFEEQGDPHCPVRIFLEYESRRPLKMLHPEARFYLGINHHAKTEDQSWFLNQPMGKNTLGTLAKRMSESGGLTARHVNHSGRKTFISNLLDAGCAPTEVAQLSGHKNLMSLNSYHALSTEKQKTMSAIIHKNCTATSTTVACQNDDISDTEILRLSQEMDPIIERTLRNINSYEQIPVFNEQAVDQSENQSVNVLDLPVRQSPGGTLSFQKLKSPTDMFSNCTFNGPVNFVFRN